MTDKQISRFMAKVDTSTSTGCWLWIASLRRDGYGQFNVDGRRGLIGTVKSAHRVAYQHFVGDVPHGLDLDHLCRNRRCVNPSHLEPVTRSENLRRGDGPALTSVRNREHRTGAALSAASIEWRKTHTYTHSPESRARISDAQRGRVFSEATRAKLRAAWVARKLRAA